MVFTLSWKLIRRILLPILLSLSLSLYVSFPLIYTSSSSSSLSRTRRLQLSPRESFDLDKKDRQESERGEGQLQERRGGRKEGRAQSPEGNFQLDNGFLEEDYNLSLQEGLHFLQPAASQRPQEVPPPPPPPPPPAAPARARGQGDGLAGGGHGVRVRGCPGDVVDAGQVQGRGLHPHLFLIESSFQIPPRSRCPCLSPTPNAPPVFVDITTSSGGGGGMKQHRNWKESQRI